VIDGAELLRFVAAFAVIALAMYGFATFSRQGAGARAFLRCAQGAGARAFLRRGRLVEVIETTPLPHSSSLHVVKLGDAYFVIGRTDGGITMLGEIPKDTIDRRGAASANGRRLNLLAPRSR